MEENSGTEMSFNALDSLLTTVLHSYLTLGLKLYNELESSPLTTFDFSSKLKIY